MNLEFLIVICITVIICVDNITRRRGKTIISRELIRESSDNKLIEKIIRKIFNV